MVYNMQGHKQIVGGTIRCPLAQRGRGFQLPLEAVEVALALLHNLSLSGLTVSRLMTTIFRFLSRRPAETANKLFIGRDELIAAHPSTVLDVVSGKILSLYPRIIG